MMPNMTQSTLTHKTEMQAIRTETTQSEDLARCYTG
jgi:hypothetical protein